MSRAVSTALDVAVFLLLVSATVGTLYLPAPVTSGPDADASLRRLSTVTANPSYSLAPGARRADESLVAFSHTSGPEFERSAHGSLASLLADAALANLSVAGEQVTHAGDGYERAVRGAVRDATGPRVHVRAVWRPYPDAPVRGAVEAGRPPPRGARVATATTTLDSGYPSVEVRARRAASDRGYAGVAEVLARAVVEGVFPPERARLGLRGDYPVDALVRYRYRRFAALTGTAVDEQVRTVRPRLANERLASALADRLERDLRASFDSPAEAARAARIDEVRVTVRRWSRE